MKLPALNMTGWSILDYELALDGIQHVNNATAWLQNQPGSYDSAKGNYSPGANFIVQIGESWCGGIIDAIVKQLEATRFDDADDEDRRIRLLLIYYAESGAAGHPLPWLMNMVAEQSRPLAT